jgi:hydrogenase/urease accessory protein HupE
MDAERNVGYGLMFAISLLMSWTLVTGLIGLLAWSDGQAPGHLAKWIGIWAFTVGIPTMQSVRIHGLLRDVAQDCPVTSAHSRRALAHARVVILVCGSMTVLFVFGLFVGR